MDGSVSTGHTPRDHIQFLPLSWEAFNEGVCFLCDHASEHSLAYSFFTELRLSEMVCRHAVSVAGFLKKPTCQAPAYIAMILMFSLIALYPTAEHICKALANH